MSRKQRLPLTIVGRTDDGRDAIGGVFPYVDQEGIPLDIVRETLKERGQVVALDDFVIAALHHGWKHKTIIPWRIRTRQTSRIPRR